METQKERKIALITGASSGIGLSLAKIFSREGYSLVLVSRDKKKLQEVKTEIENETMQKVHVIAKDLSLPSSVQEVFDEIQQLGINITALVNNAGWGDYGTFAESDRTKQLNMIDLNVRSLTELTYLFLPMLHSQKAGYILNISSVLGFVPGPFMSVYAASKAYVLSFSEALTEELRESNISVTVLCPGKTSTNFLKRTMDGSNEPFENTGMTADQVAQIGYTALMQGQSVIVPGFKNKIFTSLPRFLPRPLVRRIVRYMITR
jgi:short-subunit dehydrogenase